MEMLQLKRASIGTRKSCRKWKERALRRPLSKQIWLTTCW